jgi:type I restriction enzyme, R subunit
MFVCSKREIAYALWRELIALRPEWNEVLACERRGGKLTERGEKGDQAHGAGQADHDPGKDDPKELYDLLGTPEYRKELDRQFKQPSPTSRSPSWSICG